MKKNVVVKQVRFKSLESKRGCKTRKEKEGEREHFESVKTISPSMLFGHFEVIYGGFKKKGQ